MTERRLNILFIDDEPIRAWPLVEAGHDVRIAHGFEQIDFYLRRCPGYKPDVICLDHDMPLMNGYAVAEAFLWNQAVPIVIHSMNDRGADDIARLLSTFGRRHERSPIYGVRSDVWIKWLEDFVNTIGE